MALSTSEERGELINRTIGLSHLRQIEAVRSDLQVWLQAHPDDEGIRQIDAHLAEQQAATKRQSAGTFAYLTTTPERVIVTQPGPGEGGPTAVS
jgi:hypothetical protein